MTPSKSSLESAADKGLIEPHSGYIKADRIHDARYIEDCKLVYVHLKAFGFTAEDYW